MNNFHGDNPHTSGEGNDFLVYIAQFINHEDAARNYDATHNGDNVPSMPEAGGGGAYVETVEQLSPSQRQTYDNLVVGTSLIIPTLIVIVVFVFAIRRMFGPRKVKHGSR